MQKKKIVYITLTAILGVMLSYLAHAAIEISVLRTYTSSAIGVEWSSHFGIGYCALNPIIQYGLFALGVAGGILIGLFWWRIVYIEKRHWRLRTKK